MKSWLSFNKREGFHEIWERRIKQLRRLHLQINYVLLVPAQITINWIQTTIKTICLLLQHVSTIFYSYHYTKAKPNQRLQFFSQSSSSAAKMLPFVLVLLNWFPWQTLVSVFSSWEIYSSSLKSGYVQMHIPKRHGQLVSCEADEYEALWPPNFSF